MAHQVIADGRAAAGPAPVSFAADGFDLHLRPAGSIRTHAVAGCSPSCPRGACPFPRASCPMKRHSLAVVLLFALAHSAAASDSPKLWPPQGKTEGGLEY